MIKYNLTRLLFVAVLCFGWHHTKAQQSEKHLPLIASVFNNGTLLPGAGKLGVFSIPVHLGFSIGTEFRYNKHPGNEWFQTAKMGYHYHQYVQHSLQLFSEFGYRRHFKGRLDASPRLGLGYIHSIPNTQIFEAGEDGQYRREKNWGRPQFMTSLALEIGYEAFNWKNQPARFFVAYQFYLQMPFVKKYVPLLPNSALHVGIALPFWKTKKQS